MALVDYLGSLSLFFLEVCRTLARPPWFGREIVAQMFYLGVRTLPLTMVAALALGLVLAMQGVKVLTWFGAGNYIATLVAFTVLRDDGAIASVLENQNFQAALDANATKRAAARQIAIETLDQDWESLRQRAHTNRATTIAHLDTFLEQFSAKAQENCWFIHRAQSAEQAVEIVLKIARLNQAKLLAKSKTMVSEEIGLNHALQQAGVRVVETDFGEYIVQLRHERPAHITTPAVHLRLADVAQTFHEELGLPVTEEVEPRVEHLSGERDRSSLSASG